MSVLDGNGRILSTILQGDNGSAPFSFCLDDGTFVLQRAIGEIAARQNRITRLRADGSVVNVIGTFAAPGFDLVTMVGPTFAVSGNALYDGDPFTSEIRVYDPSGRLRRIIRTSDVGVRITDQEAEQRMGMTIPGNVTAEERKKRMIECVPFRARGVGQCFSGWRSDPTAQSGYRTTCNPVGRRTRGPRSIQQAGSLADSSSRQSLPGR